MLDDGSGPIRISFADDLPWRWPYVRNGDIWMAAGVVSQYVAARPYTGGYRLMPRLATDFSRSPLFLADFSQAPLFLPVTGTSEACQQPVPVVE